MGYMIMECGLGAFLAVFHLIAHGPFKGTVFLNCGNVIHKARQEPSFPTSIGRREESSSNLDLVDRILQHHVGVAADHPAGHHGVLRIPLLESQGTVISCFSSGSPRRRPSLSLTRIRAVASWKVSAAMLGDPWSLVFTYLFAVGELHPLLVPEPQEVASYFRRRHFPGDSSTAWSSAPP